LNCYLVLQRYLLIIWFKKQLLATGYAIFNAVKHIIIASEMKSIAVVLGSLISGGGGECASRYTVRPAHGHIYHENMYPSVLKKYTLFLLLAAVLILPLPLFSQETKPGKILPEDTDEELLNQQNSKIHLDISCHSGTPPVLEFELTDPDGVVDRINIDFDDDGKTDISLVPKKEVVFRGIPYRREGLYRLQAVLQTKYGNFHRAYTVAFTHFVWGKNNFNFANDGVFENKIDFVSDTILDWAQYRFGDIDSERKVLLITAMYRMYKGSIGRCYGFTGGEIYYLNHPEKLPAPYACAYDLREDDMNLIRKMDFIQNDIVFANYLSGRIDIEKDQNREALEKELMRIEQSIRANSPMIIGYISSRMHHSMVVYGYFENLYRGSVTLLTANNWERDQNNNLFSEDAENIVIRFSADRPNLSWYDVTKKRYRYPRKIFAVEPQARYKFSKEEFVDLLRNTENSIVNDGRAVIIVEKTASAYIVDSAGKKRGYSKPQFFSDIKEVEFKKIDYNFIFDVPATGEYTLHLEKRRYNSEKKSYKKVNIFAIFPNGEDVITQVLNDVKVDDTEETVFEIEKGGIRLVGHD